MLSAYGRELIPVAQRRSNMAESQIEASKSTISGTISKAVVTGSTPGSATAIAATTT